MASSRPATNTVINSGTITDDSSFIGGATLRYAVHFTGNGNRLAVETGAVFNGAIVADGAANTLAFGGVATKQTISGIGSTYVGFTILSIEKSANWSLSQTVAFDALTVEAAGTLGIASSVILTVSGSGSTIRRHNSGRRNAQGSPAAARPWPPARLSRSPTGRFPGPTPSASTGTEHAARIADDRNTTLTFASGTTTTLTANGSTFGGAR